MTPLGPDEIRASARHPDFYIRHVLGIEQLAGDYVLDMIRDVAHHRECRWQGARGIAKSWMLGILASWWFDVMPKSLVLITGTVYRQVMNAWRECKKARRHANFVMPGRILETDGLRDDSDEDHRIIPFAARDADSVLGGHADYVLVLVDESSGMRPAICEALYGSLSGPLDRIVWSGNPLHTSGHFADLANRSDVRNHVVSVTQTTNYIEGRQVVRGIAGREYAESIAHAFGQDSDVYRVHVLGLMPREGGNSIFSLAGVRDARERGEGAPSATESDVRVVGGLDLARLGTDRCALLTLSGGVLKEIEKWGGRTLDYTMDRARAWLNGHESGVLHVDATSEGTFSDVLVREFPGRVVGVNFGGPPVLGRTLPRPNASAKPRPLYQNRRAEMWYEAAKWTAADGVWSSALPEDKVAELEVDLLSAIRIDPSPTGQLRVEAKEKARKRLGRSPDLGDAYCLAVSGLLAGDRQPRSSRPTPERERTLDEVRSGVEAGRLRYSRRTGGLRPVGALGGRKRRR